MPKGTFPFLMIAVQEVTPAALPTDVALGAAPLFPFQVLKGIQHTSSVVPLLRVEPRQEFPFQVLTYWI